VEGDPWSRNFKQKSVAGIKNKAVPMQTIVNARGLSDGLNEKALMNNAFFEEKDQVVCQL
jgi:hypothetical protein